jgi:hypothetical protein
MLKGSMSTEGEILSNFFCVLGAVAYLQVSPLGGSHDETWCGQGIRKHSVSLNLPKLSQLWWCNGGFPAHRQPLNWNFMYHSIIVLSVGGSVWYVVCLCCIVTVDSLLANSKTQNTFLFPVHLMFHHDCPLAVKPASMPRHLGHKRKFRDSLPVDMLPFDLTILATVLQRSEILEGLMNYPVVCMCVCSFCQWMKPNLNIWLKLLWNIGVCLCV